MRVEIQLDPGAARDLHQAAAPGGRSRGGGASNAVLRAARELGVAVMPVHPGQTHDLLAPYFYADVPDRATAERVATRLRQVPGVEAAWVRPADEAP